MIQDQITQPAPPDPQIYDARQVAAILRLCYKTALKIMRSGQLHCLPGTGAKIRCSREQLDAYLATGIGPKPRAKRSQTGAKP